MKIYTDYCTCFYDPEKREVIFYDEIKERAIGRDKVNGKKEADRVMQIWKDRAPEGIICEIIGIE